jgi:hypothetical protein
MCGVLFLSLLKQMTWSFICLSATLISLPLEDVVIVANLLRNVARHILNEDDKQDGGYYRSLWHA